MAETEAICWLKSVIGGEVKVMGTVYYSVQDGDWMSPSTWSPSGVPGLYADGDVAVIRHDIDIDTTRMGGTGSTWRWSLPYFLDGIIFEQHPTIPGRHGRLRFIAPPYHVNLPSPQGAICNLTIRATSPGSGIRFYYEKVGFNIAPSPLISVGYFPYSPPPSGIPKPYTKVFLIFYVDLDYLTPISYPLDADFDRNPTQVTMSVFLPSAKLIEIVGLRPSSSISSLLDLALFHIEPNSMLHIKVRAYSGSMVRYFYIVNPAQSIDYRLAPRTVVNYSPPQSYSFSEDKVNMQAGRQVTTTFSVSLSEKVKLQHGTPQLYHSSNSPLSTSDGVSLAPTFGKQETYILDSGEDVTLHFPQSTSPVSHSHSVSVEDRIHIDWYYPFIDESQMVGGVERVALHTNQWTNSESGGEELSSVVLQVDAQQEQSSNMSSEEAVNVYLNVVASQILDYEISTSYYLALKDEVVDVSVQDERVTLSPQVAAVASFTNISYDTNIKINTLVTSSTIMPSIELVRLPLHEIVVDADTSSRSKENAVILFDNLEVTSDSPLTFYNRLIFPSSEEETYDYMNFIDRVTIEKGQIWSVASLSPLVSSDVATIHSGLTAHTVTGDFIYADRVNLDATTASFHLYPAELSAQTSVLLGKVIEQSETHTLVFSSSVLSSILLNM